MPARLDHTIVHCRSQPTSAAFFAEILALGEPRPFGPFLVVDLENGVSLDFIEVGEHPFIAQHYAFLVSEPEFDRSFARIRERGLPFWADPHKQEPGDINHHDGGRGVYFEDPDGHLLELITRRYGSGGDGGAT